MSEYHSIPYTEKYPYGVCIVYRVHFKLGSGINPMIHRVDGPAVLWEDGKVHWFFEGKELSLKEWARKTNIDDEKLVEYKFKYYDAEWMFISANFSDEK